jgi:hypothetical protein
MRHFVISLVVWSVCQPLLHAGERLTPERLWQLARLGSVCLSPDGNHVAYAVRRYNLVENQGRFEISDFCRRGSGQSEGVTDLDTHCLHV